jgi:hypothetical protein
MAGLDDWYGWLLCVVGMDGWTIVNLMVMTFALTGIGGRVGGEIEEGGEHKVKTAKLNFEVVYYQ